MFKEELKKFVEDNAKLVSMKPAGDGIYVLKYKRTVFYDNLWNEFLEECRGTIVDADFNVVTRPFTKIYNYGIEAKAPVITPETPVTAFRKVNGFMVAMTSHNGELLISTTGSTANDYVDYAKEMMAKHMPLLDWQMALSTPDCHGMTFMFECVHPSDPHIIPEEPGMYILGYRENTWDSRVGHDISTLEEIGKMLKCYVPEAMRVEMSLVEHLVKKVRHEGFVIYTDDGRATKIKSPYYLVKKWVARNPRTDKLVNLQKDIKKNIDEEYYPLIDAIRLNIEEYTAMTEQERLSWVRAVMEKQHG